MVDFKKYEQHDKEPLAACENPSVPMGKWALANLPKKPAKILDVGCGTGLHTKWFNGLGIDTIGITINPREIEKRLHPKVQYGDMLEIPFGNQTFDFVFCLGTLEHTHAPFIALCEFNRVLKVGGYLFVDMPGIRTMMITNKVYWYHKNVLFPIQMRDLFLRTNFKMVKANYFEEIDDNMYRANANARYLAQKIEDIKL